jgi:hypothetical protein
MAAATISIIAVRRPIHANCRRRFHDKEGAVSSLSGSGQAPYDAVVRRHLAAEQWEAAGLIGNGEEAVKVAIAQRLSRFACKKILQVPPSRRLYRPAAHQFRMTYPGPSADCPLVPAEKLRKPPFCRRPDLAIHHEPSPVHRNSTDEHNYPQSAAIVSACRTTRSTAAFCKSGG